MVRTVDQPYPPFLELLETDPALALEQFERGARGWLRSHPTASMRSLTAAERQDVIDETIRRCLAGGGEALRGYTDMWGSFAAWLAGVADSTCAARFGARRARPTPTPNRRPRPKGGPAPEAPTPAAAQVAPDGRSGSVASAAPRDPTAGRPARDRWRLDWFKKTHFLLPVAVLSLLAAVHAFRSTADRPGRTSVIAGPIDLALAPEEPGHPVEDIVTLIDVAGAGADVRPVTIVFRSGRPTILRLLLGEPGGQPAPSRVVVEDGDGEVAWETAVDPSISGGAFLDLRIDTRTVPSGEYAIRAVGAGDTEIFRSVFTVADQ